MREVVEYLWRMTPGAVVGLVLYAVTAPLRGRRAKRLGLATAYRHELGLMALFLFTAGLLWLTVLPRILWVDGHLVFRQEGFGNINLRPFLIFQQSRVLAHQGHKSYFLINFWGNIAMFLPIGFLPGLLWRRWTWWKALLCGFGLSLSIEVLQIPINRGTDIDDLWLNTLGAMVGWGLYRALRHLAPRWTRTFQVTGEGQ